MPSLLLLAGRIIETCIMYPNVIIRIYVPLILFQQVESNKTTKCKTEYVAPHGCVSVVSARHFRFGTVIKISAKCRIHTKLARLKDMHLQKYMTPN